MSNKIKKRNDGRFSKQIYLGIVDDKRKYKTVYGKTQKEVNEKALEIKIGSCNILSERKKYR